MNIKQTSMIFEEKKIIEKLVKQITDYQKCLLKLINFWFSQIEREYEKGSKRGLITNNRNK